MWSALGLFFLVYGLALAVITLICNSGTPVQLGPIPFFGGLATAAIGFVLLLHFSWHVWYLVAALAAAVVASLATLSWLL